MRLKPVAVDDFCAVRSLANVTFSPAGTSACFTVSQAKKEKQQGFLPPLKNPLDMVSRNDVILVGSPSWWGTFAGPVRTFLSTAALDGKTLIPFITHEGSGLGSAPADLRRLCPSAKTGEGLAIRGSRVDGARRQVESWLRKAGLLPA